MLLITEAYATVSGGVFFVVINGLIHPMDPDSCFLALVVFLFAVYFTVVYITVPFVYRYVLVCRNEVMSGGSFMLLLGFAFLSGFSVAFTCYVCLHDSAWALVLDHAESLLPCHYPSMIPVFRMELSYTTSVPWVIAVVTVGYNYCMVMWCSVRIWTRVKCARNMSLATREVNEQLNCVLVVQASCPIFFMVLPITGMFLTIYTQQQAADYLKLITTAVSWVPVLNPLSSIYFVKCYRSKICSVLSFRSGSGIEPTATDEQFSSEVFL